MAGSGRRSSDRTKARQRGAPVVQKRSLAAQLGWPETPEVQAFVKQYGRTLLEQQRVVSASEQNWRFKRCAEPRTRGEHSRNVEEAVVEVIDAVRRGIDPDDQSNAADASTAAVPGPPRKGQRTALARGFESLLNHPDFARHEFRLAALTATNERDAWNRAEFADSAWRLFERLREFYELIRTRFAAQDLVPQSESYSLESSHPHLRLLAPPPRELREVLVAATAVGRGVTRLLELPPERGRTADASASWSTWRLYLTAAGYPTHAWFGDGSRTEVELLDPALLNVLYARGRGGPVAAAEAACARMLGRSTRAISNLVRALRSLRAAADYCAAPVSPRR